MDNIDSEANGFRIEDAAGEVPIAEVVYPQDHRVELILERPLRGTARVHGGYGMAPATVPADMERFLPMLGFWGVEISLWSHPRVPGALWSAGGFPGIPGDHPTDNPGTFGRHGLKP